MRAMTRAAMTAARRMTDLIPLVRPTSSRLSTSSLTANFKGLNPSLERNKAATSVGRSTPAATARHLWSRARSRIPPTLQRCQVQKLGTTLETSFPVIPTLTDGAHLDIPPSTRIYKVPAPMLRLLLLLLHHHHHSLRPSSRRYPIYRQTIPTATPDTKPHPLTSLHAPHRLAPAVQMRARLTP